jgi:hypothetical protein
MVDIKPGVCPNSLQVKSKGVLSVAIIGSEDIDVMHIDASTVRLGKDGLADTVAPLRWTYRDVSHPSDEEPCECEELMADGYTDLVLMFDSQAVVNSLELKKGFGHKGFERDELSFSLAITGNLKEEFGGTPISGEDCIRWK